MRKRITLIMRALAVALGVFVLTCGPAHAQVKEQRANLPRLDKTTHSPLIPWGIAGVFTAGILGVAFRNAKRTHSD